MLMIVVVVVVISHADVPKTLRRYNDSGRRVIV